MHNAIFTIAAGVSAKADAFVGCFEPGPACLRMNAQPHHVENVAAGTRGNDIGHSLGQRFQDHLRREQGGPDCERRGRRHRMHHFSLRRNHLHRPKIAFVRWRIRRRDAFKGERAHTQRAAKWQVHRPSCRRVRTRPVDDHLLIANGDGDFHFEHGVLVDAIIIEPVFGSPGTFWQLGQPRAGDALAMIQDFLCGGHVGLETEPVHQLLHTALSSAARRDLGVHVSDHAVRQPAVEFDNVQQFLV